jgi:catechol 2,3-dioxygenase-like lactoylglutathione lyase family enzyme
MSRFGTRLPAVVATCLLFLAATARPVPAQTPAAPAAEVIGIGPLFHIVADIDRSVALYRGLLGLPPADAAPRTFAADPELQQLYNLPGGRESASVVRIPGSQLSLEFVEWKDVDRSPVQPRVQDPGATVLMLTVQDLTKSMIWLVEHGALLVGRGAGPVSIDDERGKRRVVLLKDPDGFFIELTQPDTPPQATAQNGIVGATFAVTIDDTDKTMRFYREVFGFQPEAGMSFVPDKAWLNTRLGPEAQLRRSAALVPGSSVRMEFLEFKKIDRKRLRSRLQDPGTSMLQLSVRDVNTIVKASKAAGGSILTAGGGATVRHGSPIAIVGDANNFFLEPMQPAPAQTASAAPREPEWVTRSNANAQILMRISARYNPEVASRDGVAGLDEAIATFPSDRRERIRADVEAALKELQQRLTAETDPLVAQDLRILIRAAQDMIRSQDLSEKYELPYFNVPQMIFSGVRGLLDDQVPPARQKAALVRLRKYVGIEPGYEPLTAQIKARTREWSRSGQLGPAKIQVDTDLTRADFFVNGIADLFAQHHIDGYQAPMAALKQQMADYQAWIRQEILPRARTDFRLPAEQYAFALQRFGVDVPPEQLTADAHRAFAEWQQEMQAVADQIARARDLSATDYRDVIRELKKEQLVGDAILPHYQQRLREIEAIISRERLVTLPVRPARIRLASPAETAQQPAPHMDPPPLLNNTGQQGEFVLPLNVPTRPGSSDTAQIDDFTFAAASWTLIAHEARPGHELQFASMVEHGVSLARSLFAFNSVNVEGWGLYAEHILKPYEPLEGQLIALQLRLMRAARAFIDPELQSGRLTPDEGMRILTKDVMLSAAFANTEIERYTFRSPGQATSYFYGYTKLRELRQDVEAKLGPRFDQQKYHDFILAQGLLPPDLLRTAVMDGFAQ